MTRFDLHLRFVIIKTVAVSAPSTKVFGIALRFRELVTKMFQDYAIVSALPSGPEVQVYSMIKPDYHSSRALPIKYREKPGCARQTWLPHP
jgi:hypothetical protein